LFKDHFAIFRKKMAKSGGESHFVWQCGVVIFEQTLNVAAINAAACWIGITTSVLRDVAAYSLSIVLPRDLREF